MHRASEKCETSLIYAYEKTQRLRQIERRKNIEEIMAEYFLN
jgi:hypothetical protein